MQSDVEYHTTKNTNFALKKNCWYEYVLAHVSIPALSKSDIYKQT